MYLVRLFPVFVFCFALEAIAPVHVLCFMVSTVEVHALGVEP